MDSTGEVGDEAATGWVPHDLREELRVLCSRYEENGFERAVIAAALRQLAREMEGHC